MTVIKDSATGNVASVTNEQRLRTDSVTRPLAQHINEVYEKHLTLTFDGIDPVGADDYFFYYKNTGNKNIHFTKFRFHSTVPGSVALNHVSGTAAYTADADLVPVNRYLGSTNGITATIKTDTNVTGLTNQGTMITLRIDTANKDHIDDAPSHIIVPPGQAMGLLWDTATGILGGTIDLYEDQGVL